MFANIRQLRFPREFRISHEPWPEDLTEHVELLSRAVEAVKAASEEGAESVSPALADTEALLADVGTGLWRMKQKMVEPGTGQPLETMRRPYRHVEAVWDALSQAGIKIQDHTGSAFDSGMSLSVLCFQPTPEITAETVIETIKPTIYLKDSRIQMGEVIVGKPSTPDDSGV